MRNYLRVITALLAAAIVIAGAVSASEELGDMLTPNDWEEQSVSAANAAAVSRQKTVDVRLAAETEMTVDVKKSEETLSLQLTMTHTFVEETAVCFVVVLYDETGRMTEIRTLDAMLRPETQFVSDRLELPLLNGGALKVTAVDERQNPLVHAYRAEVGSDGEIRVPYLELEAERVAANVAAVKTEDSFVLAAMSDAHIGMNQGSVISSEHAGQGVALLRDLLEPDMVAHMGDYITGGSRSGREESIDEYNTYRNIMEEACGDLPSVWLVGNHDANYQSEIAEPFTFEELYTYIGANKRGEHVTTPDGEQRMYGYLDFPDKKLRIIYLNTSDAAAKTGVSAAQAKWLEEEALDFSGVEDVSEWGILVLTHIPLTFLDAKALMDAVDSYALSDDGAEVIAIIHGHTHNFRTEQVGEANIWQIAIPPLCVGRDNEYATAKPDIFNDYAAIFGEFDSSGKPVYYKKTQGTAEDTGFCMVTVDRVNRKIFCHRFGVGYDRVLCY